MSRSRTDPIVMWRRRLVLVTSIGGAAVVTATWWCVMVPPVVTPVVPVPVPSQAGAAVVEADAILGIDSDHFKVALWNPRPAPAPVEAPAAPPPREPLRLELLGIIETDGHLRAALYNPAEDRIHLVGNGERIGSCEVIRLLADRVELHDGERAHLLRLREDPS